MTLLLTRGANLNAEIVFRDTPLHFAIRNEDIDVVKTLLEYGVDVHIKYCSRSTVLKLASRIKGATTKNRITAFFKTSRC